MGQVISVCGVKGGVGKSTIAAHLVGWLVKQGGTVGVVDSDVQAACIRWLGEVLPDVETVAALSADDILGAIPNMLERHQFVVCDGAAGEAEGTRALLLRADLAILPVGPSTLDLSALHSTAALVRQARSIRGGRPDALVCMNRMQHTMVSRDVADAVPELGLRVAKTVIRQRVAFSDAPQQATFVWDMGSSARDAAAEMESLLTEVLGLGSEKEAPDRGAGRSRTRVHRRNGGRDHEAAR